MKRFRKTFFTVILSFLLAFSCFLTAFADDIDKSAFESFAVTVIGDVTALSDDELNTMSESYKTAYPGFAEGLSEWKSIKNEAGEFVSINSCEVTENEDGSFRISASADFTEKECNVIIGIGADGYISSLSFEIPASRGSLMKDAFSNLVVGMGTVFIVLIFLCFIISLFRYISIAEKKMADKKAGKKAVVSTVADIENRRIEITPAAEAGNDEELKAVIAAAIAAYEADSECRIEKQPVLNNGITVRSYRRK